MKISFIHPRLKRLISDVTLGDFVFIALLFVYSLIGMRNFKLSIANFGDDNPIFYAQAFKEPVLFSGDSLFGFPLDSLVDLKVVTSVMVWIPALLWRYLNIDPYSSTWLLTLIQGFSMILAVYVLAIAMVNDRLAAAIAAIFAAITAPWMWGLANFGNNADWTFLPYAAQLAMAPVLLAFVFLIRRGKTVVTLLLLVVGGLIHPTMALYACAMIGIYWLWEGSQSSWRRVLWRLAGLLAAVFVIMLPSLWVMLTQTIDQLPQAKIIAGMRPNQHLWPWNSQHIWGFSWRTVLKWLGLAILSWRYEASFAPPLRRLWLATLAGAGLLSLSQIIGIVIQNPTLITLIGLRSFCWVALLSLPLIAYYWYSHLRSDSLPGVVLSLICLVLPFYSARYALFWLPILGLLAVDASQGQISFLKFTLSDWMRHSLIWSACALVLGWAAIFLLLPTEFLSTPPSWVTVLAELTWGQYYSLPSPAIRIKLLVVILVLGSLLWGVSQLRTVMPLKFPKFIQQDTLMPLSMGIIVAIYGGWFLWSNWQAADLLSRSSLVNTLEVQLWARDHTPPSTLFLYPGDGWRTLSLRRQLSPYTRESYSYSAPYQAEEFRDRMLAFYGISAEQGERLRGDEIVAIERNLFGNFTESDFMRFASNFGAQYLVLPSIYKVTATIDFDFPVAYENQYYIVYKIETPIKGGSSNP
jgi:hypothetical protein